MESSKLWFLKRINLFRCLGNSELEELSHIAQFRKLRRNELVFGLEDRGDAIHLIQRGRVKLSRFIESGKEITLAILEEGEFFGEEALAEGVIRRSCAEALDDGLIVRMESDDFEKLLQENVDLSVAVTRQLCERRLGDRARLDEMALHDLPRRLAAAILGMVDTETKVLPWITPQEMATLVGSTRGKTTAQLSEFKRDGMLATEGRALMVLDRDGLQRIVDGD